MTEYKVSKGLNQSSGWKPRATPAALRAYAIWHDMGADVAEVAASLRDPPLQMSTVVGYILEAVRLEKLDFEEDRLKLVLQELPETGSSRYKGLRKAVGLQ